MRMKEEKEMVIGGTRLYSESMIRQCRATETRAMRKRVRLGKWEREKINKDHSPERASK